MKKPLFITFLLILIFPLFGQDLNITEKKEFPRSGRVVDARFSSFRNYYAISRIPYTLEIYDRNWDRVFKHSSNMTNSAGEIEFSPDEKFLAYGGYKGINDIALIRLKDLKVVQILRGHSDWVHDLAFSNDCNYLASVGYGGKLLIWKAEGEKFLSLQEITDYEDKVSNVEFSFDDKYLLTTDDDGTVRIYQHNADSFKEVQRIKNTYSYIYGFACHPQKHEFVVGNSSGIVRYHLVKERFVPLDSIKKDLSVNNDMTYSPTGNLLTVPHRQDVRILNTEGPMMREVDAIYRHTWTTYPARFSEDGQFLSTSSVDSSLIIWEISPVSPSKKSLIASWVSDHLSSAQRKILTYDVVNDIYNRVDKSMALPRDEFETSSNYEDRRKSLEDWTLSLIQKKTEEKYNLKSTGPNQVSIPVQSIEGYNADKQIYKIRFLETEAGVEIPIAQARKFKTNWEKSSITANRSKEDGTKSYTYSNYQLIVQGEDGTFRVSPIEDPFSNYDSRAAEMSGTGSLLTQSSPQQSLPADEEGGIISHALLFATNVYDSFSELVNPVLDANTIAAELTENYNVRTEVITNASLTQTVEKIREYASNSYGKNENLLIFFAGHGIYDEVFKEGYVISSDSKADDISKTSYLSHSNLRTMINNIGCKQIFLVMDVCFGGTFDPHLATASHRGAMEMYADIPKAEFIERKTKYKTRLYLTSGGKEYVPDGRSGFHSPFARRFIEALRKYGGEDGILTTNEILQYVEKVNPQPRFGEFGDNEPGSDFILISK